MSRYWLTPVQASGDEVALREERVLLEPEDTAGAFLKLLRSVHPRMLVSFKASLLLSEDAESACGANELPFQIDSMQRVHFGPDALELSHCAQAYLDRLPSEKEMHLWLESAESLLAGTNGDPQLHGWLSLLKSWHIQGFGVTLLREDE